MATDEPIRVRHHDELNLPGGLEATDAADIYGSPVELGVSRGQERPREQGFRR